MQNRMMSLAIVLVVMMTSAGLMAAEIGQIKTIAGDVYILRHDQRLTAKVGDLLEQADILNTGEASSVGITFIDNSRFSAGPNSRIELTQFQFNPTTQEGRFTTNVKNGTLAIISGQIAKQSPDAMKIKTPTTILGVRGTRFAVKVEKD